MSEFKSVMISELLRNPESDDVRRFTDDMRALLQASPDFVAACMAEISHVKLARTKNQRQEIAKSIAAEGQYDFSATIKSLEVLLFLLRQLMDNGTLPLGDSVNWPHDFKALGIASTDEQVEASSRLLASLNDLAETKIRPETDRRKAVHAIPPCLSLCQASVCLRGVFDAELKYGMSSDEYKSRIKDIAAVVTVNITLDMDSAPDAEVTFHVDENELDYLINVLGVAKKDLEALKGFVD